MRQLITWKLEISDLKDTRLRTWCECMWKSVGLKEKQYNAKTLKK